MVFQSGKFGEAKRSTDLGASRFGGAKTTGDAKVKTKAKSTIKRKSSSGSSSRTEEPIFTGEQPISIDESKAPPIQPQSNIKRSSRSNIFTGSQPISIDESKAPLKPTVQKAPLRDDLNKFGAGMISQAPKRGRIKSFATSVKDQFVGGFQSLSGSDKSKTASVRARTGTGVESLAFTGGAVSSIFLTSASASKIPAGVSKVKKTVTAVKGTKAGKRATELFQATQKTRVGRLGTELIGGIGRSTAVLKGTEKVTEVTASKEQKALLRDSGFQEAIKTARRKEELAVKESGLLGQIGFGLSTAFSPRKDVFKSTLGEELKGQGLSETQIALGLKTARRQRIGSETGEALGLLELSRSAESFGRRELTRTIGKKGVQTTKKKVGFELAKKSFVPIGTAGIVEGFGAEVLQQQARKQDINIKKAGIGGGIGFLTAGTIGGVIAGTSVNRPGTSKVIEGVASFTDPFEKPGDLLQDFTEFGVRKITGRVPKVPIITSSIDPGSIVNIGVGRKGKKSITKIPSLIDSPKKSKRTSKTSSEIFQNAIDRKRVSGISSLSIPTTVPTPRRVRTPSLETILGFGDVKRPSPVPPNIFTPTNIPSEFTPNKPINIFSETQVPISSNIPTNIPVVVPVVTPILRSPPPVPPILPGFGGTGSGTGKRAKKKKFVNELDQGQALLGQLLGTNTRRRKTKR